MMRILGMILLIGSVLLIGINIVRFSSSTVARARDERPPSAKGHHAAVLEVTDGLSPGEWIATTELSRIRQGTRVQVKREG